MFRSKRIGKVTFLYYSLLVLWISCLIVIDVSLEPRIEHSSGFIIPLAFCGFTLGAIETNRRKEQLWFLIGFHYAIIIIPLVAYFIFRVLASDFYSLLFEYQEYHGVVLLSDAAPLNFPLVNDTLLFLCSSGVLFGIVSTVYLLEKRKNKPREPFWIRPWYVYINPFRTRERFVFLSMAALLAFTIVSVHRITGYEGALTRMPVIILFAALYIVFGSDVEDKKTRIILYVSLLLLCVSDFVLNKGMNLLVFSWYTNTYADPTVLVSKRPLGHDIEFLASMKQFIVFPEFRGNYLTLFSSEKAPDPFSWKDFILVIPVGLYMILNVIFEPQLKPPVEHEKKVVYPL